MINRNDFEKLVERRIDFITTDTIFRAWSNEEIYKKCTGFPQLVTRKSAFVDFKYYASHADIDRVKQLALKKGATNFTNSFCKQGEEYGEAVLAYSNWIRKSNWSEKTLGELRGTVACKGKVTGNARVVLTSVELDKVKRGDILITSMTTPDMIVAMQRAAAFVTDEGGITCHAAIVAREMNKPCIIGTKVATSVFKNGDTIEVDATKGIVRKL